MCKTLLLATILAAGAISLASANAVPVANLAGQAFTASSNILTVRQAGEAPRREDRRNDRRNDRRTTEAAPDGFDASQVLLVREAGSGAGRQRQRHTGNP